MLSVRVNNGQTLMLDCSQLWSSAERATFITLIYSWSTSGTTVSSQAIYTTPPLNSEMTFVCDATGTSGKFIPTTRRGTINISIRGIYIT